MEHALPIKELVCPDAPMGVGLWFAYDAAVQLLQTHEALPSFRDWLQEVGLMPYTLNGFPFGDFHEPVVKHKVYEPTWADDARYDYTFCLATILAELLPDDMPEGSISTLPIGWRQEVGAGQEKAAAKNLSKLVHQLARLELNTGKLIHVDLEPEPGCLFDRAGDVVDFFNEHLLGTPDDLSARSYLRVCHDVCHSAVMFESQSDAINHYRNAGIRVGKAQLSSAIAVDFDAMDQQSRADATAQLQGFAEDRYLHQTCIRTSDGKIVFYEDLSLALNQHEAIGEWHVHFHVPLFAKSLGLLGTTQDQVSQFLNVLKPSDELNHFEAETYAWTVLPEHLRPNTLAEGIARELQWLQSLQGFSNQGGHG